MLARHGADVLAYPVAGADEDRRDQHRRVEACLTHEPAECLRAAQATAAMHGSGGGTIGQECHVFSALKWAAMASARPGAVWSAATATTLKPSWTAVLAVTGPMQKAGTARARPRSRG